MEQIPHAWGNTDALSYITQWEKSQTKEHNAWFHLYAVLEEAEL